jgi:hypothetical protein
MRTSLRGLTCLQHGVLKREAPVIERKQRDVEMIRYNEIAAEVTGIFDHFCQTVDARRRIGTRLGS